MPAVMAFAVGAAVAVLVEHGQLVQPAQVSAATAGDGPSGNVAGCRLL